MTQQRKSEIELFRCALMLGICLLHVVGVGFGSRYGSFALHWCVVAFVFITGYFGCRFSLFKIAKLIGLAAFAVGINAICASACGERFDALLALKDYWFLYGYIVLMLFAPMVDAGMTSMRDNPPMLLAISLPIVAFSYVWSFGYSFNLMRTFIPQTAGLGAYGGFSLLAAYVGARLYWLLGWEKFLTVPRALIIIAVALPVAAIRFGT